MARIALFGGSFNPPHIAHQLACLYVRETAAVDEVWMVPTFRHPWAEGHDAPAHPIKQELAPFDDRFEMCRRAAARLPGVTVSRVEAELGGESRTLLTVQHLRKTRPGDAFTLVVGADLVAERHLWFGYRELEQLVDFFVLGRAGHGGPPPELPAVSSTDIRAALRRGDDVSRLVSQGVLSYIRERGLYQ
jgi:nicotinate-nucleotide adenylyltransferase